MDNEITKDMLIMDIIAKNPDAADVLLDFGMHCVTCMAAAGETLEEACEVHGLDADTVVDALNALV